MSLRTEIGDLAGAFLAKLLDALNQAQSTGQEEPGETSPSERSSGAKPPAQLLWRSHAARELRLGCATLSQADPALISAITVAVPRLADPEDAVATSRLSRLLAQEYHLKEQVQLGNQFITVRFVRSAE